MLIFIDICVCILVNDFGLYDFDFKLTDINDIIIITIIITIYYYYYHYILLSTKFFVKIRELFLFCFTMYTKRTCSQLI